MRPMGLFTGLVPELCTRCRKVRCSRAFKDAPPICDTCDLQIKANWEDRRFCPIDRTELEKSVLMHQVVIDRCPECAGVWLDGGELEIIQATLEDERLRDHAIRVLLRMAARRE